MHFQGETTRQLPEEISFHWNVNSSSKANGSLLDAEDTNDDPLVIEKFTDAAGNLKDVVIERLSDLKNRSRSQKLSRRFGVLQTDLDALSTSFSENKKQRFAFKDWKWTFIPFIALTAIVGFGIGFLLAVKHDLLSIEAFLFVVDFLGEFVEILWKRKRSVQDKQQNSHSTIFLGYGIRLQSIEKSNANAHTQIFQKIIFVSFFRCKCAKQTASLILNLSILIVSNAFLNKNLFDNSTLRNRIDSLDAFCVVDFALRCLHRKHSPRRKFCPFTRRITEFDSSYYQSIPFQNFNDGRRVEQSK